MKSYSELQELFNNLKVEEIKKEIAIASVNELKEFHRINYIKFYSKKRAFDTITTALGITRVIGGIEFRC